MVKKILVVAAAALTLTTLPLAAQTLCERQNRLAGEWRLAPGEEAACTVTIRAGGVLNGTCWTQEYDPFIDDWVVERFRLRGNVTLREDCSIRAVLNSPQFDGRIVGEGRVWSAGGRVPGAGVLISANNRDLWSATMYKMR